MSASNYVHIDVELIQAETDKAFLFLLEDGELVWCPKNQVADYETYSKGDTNITVSITEWIARQKGLDQ